MNRISKASLLPVVLLWAALTVFCLLKPETTLSVSERRKLATFPAISLQGILSGSYMSGFEEAATDQFPLRETFRTGNALRASVLYGQLAVHDIYAVDGYLEKLNYPLNTDSVATAAQKITELYETYFQDSTVFFAAIPDKNYYLAAENGYPSLDFDAMEQQLMEALPFAQQIDLRQVLSVESFYKTDSHWRQEALPAVAETVAQALGIPLSGSYETVLARADFLGVYAGQSALPLAAEPIYYLTNQVLEGCTVTNLETGQVGGLYDFDKLSGRDPYEFFLSGAVSLLTIENPAAPKGSRLVVFRDSYGSSLIPLLCQAYETVTVIDTRYISPGLLADYVEFDGQDVLFLYGAALLNQSNVLR